MRTTLLTALFALFALTDVVAQGHKPSYRDLTLVRNRPWAEQDFVEFRLGADASFASGEDEARQVESVTGFQGHAYLRQTQFMGRQARFDAYVGRDGFYAGLTEGDPRTSPGYSRIEFFGRQWGQFGREGFYDGDDFIPVGLYEATDWTARLSFATRFAETLRGEVGGFYGQRKFERYSRTASQWRNPDDYSVYGVHIILEENRLQLDTVNGLPTKGYLLSALIEREWNDSNELFGITGRESSLPSALIRGYGHLEYYFPYTNSGTWVVQVDASISPEDDRVHIYDSSKPIGRIWVDGRVDYRLQIGDTLSVIPGARVQWIRLADEFRTGDTDEIFFGAQVELRADFSQDFAIALNYSFLSNESREPVLFGRDTMGEHRVWLGFEFRP